MTLLALAHGLDMQHMLVSDFEEQEFEHVWDRASIIVIIVHSHGCPGVRQRSMATLCGISSVCTITCHLPVESCAYPGRMKRSSESHTCFLRYVYGFQLQLP